MKSRIVIFVIVSLLVSLSACSSYSEESGTSAGNMDVISSEPDLDADTSPEEISSLQSELSGAMAEESNKVLVTYFSWADNAVIEGNVDAITSPSVTAPGNVAQLAA